MSSPAHKVRVIIWAAFLAFLILIIGQSLWAFLLAANFARGEAFPWSVAVMAGVLWAIWRYLGGRWWPRNTAGTRRRLLRANGVSGATFGLAFVAGLFAVASLAGCWIVLFQLVRAPANVLPDISKYPLPTVVLVLAMSSLVSPIVEEAGFRGYCQQMLEREFSGLFAVLLSSLLFMLAHSNHGWYWTKLLIYFLAGVTFGTIAYLTDSILTSLPVHIVGDAVFFTMVWPYDSASRLVADGGADAWFWIHVAQAAVCGAFALLLFQKLAKHSSRPQSLSGTAKIPAAPEFPNPSA